LFKPISIAITILATTVFLSGCHHKQVATESAAAPTQAANAEEVSKQIPPDLFKSMPMYPGAEVTHVRKPKGAMREISFQIKSSPPLNQMIEFYKDGLKKNDFKITSTLTMAARKTWSCDFHKDGRPGSVMLYPDDKDKSTTVVDLIYEMPSRVDPALFEPKEDFDVIGPGPPGSSASNIKPIAQKTSQAKVKHKKTKRD
jgi:hypothetical protein